MTAITPIPTRRDRFRQMIAGLDGSAPPLSALGSGWVLDRPVPVAHRIARALELRPHSRHLLLGSIGSGKTTELHLLQTILAQEAPDVRVHLTEASPGDALRNACFSSHDLDFPEELDDRVFLIDGLDRSSVADFDAVMADLHDLPTSTGLVVVGPPQLLVRPPSLEGDWFEQTHICGLFDPDEPRDLAFLMRVLELRSQGAVRGDVAERLARDSASILRDLLLMARVTVEEAYAAGDDEPTLAHARVAVRRFTDNLQRGLHTQDFHFLRQADQGLLRFSDKRLGHLIARRALLPPTDGSTDLRPHPLLRPLLADLP